MKDSRPGPNAFAVLRPLVSGIALLALLSSAAPAAEPETKFKQKFFLTLSGQSLSLKGDFDGRLVLWHFERAFFVPRLDNAVGFGLGFGGTHPAGDWHGTYLQSSHTASWEGGKSQAQFRVLEVTGRAFLFKSLPVHPYLSLGLGISWLKVSRSTRFHGLVGDASYTGLSLNGGAGVNARVGTKLFLFGGIVYRTVGYFYVTATGGKGRDIQDLTVGQAGPEWNKWLRTPARSYVFGLGMNL